MKNSPLKDNHQKTELIDILKKYNEKQKDLKILIKAKLERKKKII